MLGFTKPITETILWHVWMPCGDNALLIKCLWSTNAGKLMLHSDNSEIKVLLKLKLNYIYLKKIFQISHYLTQECWYGIIELNKLCP